MKHNNFLLSVNNLSVTFAKNEHVLQNVSLYINRGESVALVGESGSGKSLTALSILGLLPKQAKIITSEIHFDGLILNSLKKSQMRKLRGQRISMIFQEPMTALNPVFTVGEQISEVIRLHQAKNRKEAQQEAIQMLAKVGISAPEERYASYPHQLSGGMLQRVMIAIALSCKPDLLLADEPTTALDVTIQAQILELISKIQHESGMAMLFITHDLAVAYQSCERVHVMYAGQIIEQAASQQLFKTPKHPYTKALLESTPSYRSSYNNRLQTIEGTMPKLSQRTKNSCLFSPRCPYSQNKCTQEKPPTLDFDTSHSQAKCWYPLS